MEIFLPMPIPDSDPIINIPMITPFDDDDRVDLDAVARNVERWMQTPLGCFLVGSASAEEWFLSEEEKLDIARRPSRKRCGGRKRLLQSVPRWSAFAYPDSKPLSSIISNRFFHDVQFPCC